MRPVTEVKSVLYSDVRIDLDTPIRSMPEIHRDTISADYTATWAEDSGKVKTFESTSVMWLTLEHRDSLDDYAARIRGLELSIPREDQSPVSFLYRLIAKARPMLPYFEGAIADQQH